MHSALGAFFILLTGAVAAVFGALAGLGGGFLIVPVLRLFFEVPPALAAGGALLFVFANTLAASITYLRRRIVDLPRGITISAAGIPSSILGAYVVRLLTARNFDAIYGAFLVAVGIMVLLRHGAQPKPRELS
ncbi:MAG: TSUP family transporter, partial [Polyangiaceae bacterium]